MTKNKIMEQLNYEISQGIGDKKEQRKLIKQLEKIENEDLEYEIRQYVENNYKRRSYG